MTTNKEYKLTKEDHENITYLKKILTTIFATVATSKLTPVIAMTELLVFALSEPCRDLGDLNQACESYYKNVMLPTAKSIGTHHIETFQKLREIERKNPGAIDAMAELARANADVQVRMVHPDEMDNQPGVRVGATGNTTKH